MEGGGGGWRRTSPRCPWLGAVQKHLKEGTSFLIMSQHSTLHARGLRASSHLRLTAGHLQWSPRAGPQGAQQSEGKSRAGVADRALRRPLMRSGSSHCTWEMSQSRQQEPPWPRATQTADTQTVITLHTSLLQMFKAIREDVGSMIEKLRKHQVCR